MMEETGPEALLLLKLIGGVLRIVLDRTIGVTMQRTAEGISRAARCAQGTRWRCSAMTSKKSSRAMDCGW
jgi:hypothetical protein